MGVCRGARIVRPVPEDGLVRIEDVVVDTSEPLCALWKEQMALVAS
jgi:hypothetical protein